MQKKAAYELLDWQAQQSPLVLMCRVPPTEGDMTVCQRDQSVVGNRHPVRVAAQIAQRVFGSAERALGIDYPIGVEQRAEPCGKRLGCLEIRESSINSRSSISQFPERTHVRTPGLP
jgi:hypothetical protein